MEVRKAGGGCAGGDAVKTSCDWNEKIAKTGEVHLEVLGGEMGSTGCDGEDLV